MNKHHRSHIDAAISELTKHGAEIVREDWNHIHPRVVFRWHGKEQSYVASKTPGDRRGVRAVRMTIRHMLGVASRQKTVGKRRGRKNYAETAPSPCPASITVGHDGTSILAQHELADEVTRLRYHRAWETFWADVKASLGFVGPWLEPIGYERRAA